MALSFLTFSNLKESQKVKNIPTPLTGEGEESRNFQRNLISSAKKEEQDRGGLFGSIESAIEKAHHYEGNHKEPDNQGEQRISCNPLPMGGNHLLFS